MKKSKELRKIIEPIVEDMRLFQREFEDALRSEVRLIDIISHYLLRHKGKGIRPIVTILSARISGHPTLNSYKAAALVELLHIATLMHDDVVDNAERRRGFPTVHRIWKDKASIIMGDFLLSKVLTNVIRLRDFQALDLISRTAEKLSSGEMLQIEKSFRKTMSEDVYYRMIKDKTASLMATCCELGVLTTSKDELHKEALGSYGENLGMAFQIKDDLFDLLGSEQSTGKDSHADVAKNMITLPIIHTLSSSLSPAEKRHIRQSLSNGSNHRELIKLQKIVEDHGGFDYAKKKIGEYSELAIERLTLFPDSPYKRSMIDLAVYNAQRTS